MGFFLMWTSGNGLSRWGVAFVEVREWGTRFFLTKKKLFFIPLYTACRVQNRLYQLVGQTGYHQEYRESKPSNEAKIRNRRCETTIVFKFRKLRLLFVSKTGNLPTEAVAATAASAIFRLLISTISQNF